MKALVLSSGGVDSSTCLALAADKLGKDNVISLSMYYGQKHDRELKAAKQLAAHSSLLKNSDKNIPSGSYSLQQIENDGKPVSTYVPFRNGLFLSCAASIALSKECEIIYYGAHSDDVAGDAYPDCSTAFNDAINKAIYEGSGRQLRVEAPFLNLNKADVVKKGLELEVPFELTWSCYEGGEKPCEACATCIDRAKAFELNGVEDPAIKR